MEKTKVLNIPKRNTPVILNSFAPENGDYGFIWKIYIEAEDSNGGMDKIAAIVDQTGYGYYPTDWILLKPQYRKHFIGYLQWNTFSSKGSYLAERTQITLKVSIFDQAGEESNEVVFPFAFESGVKNRYPHELPPPFDKGNIPRLGYIMIDLYSERV
jgi:hypothetical protein